MRQFGKQLLRRATSIRHTFSALTVDSRTFFGVSMEYSGPEMGGIDFLDYSAPP
jgi:hypothetical protein